MPDHTSTSPAAKPDPQAMTPFSETAISVSWQWARFDQLSAADVYAILQQRQDVFVMEQACLFQDIDGIDQQSHHLLAWRERDGVRRLGAYLRCVPPGVQSAHLHLGRVLCARAERGSGLGKALFAEGIRRTTMAYPGQPIYISAQQYLENFYQCFGFVTQSSAYLEDGIWHVDMVRSTS